MSPSNSVHNVCNSGLFNTESCEVWRNHKNMYILFKPESFKHGFGSVAAYIMQLHSLIPCVMSSIWDYYCIMHYCKCVNTVYGESIHCVCPQRGQLNKKCGYEYGGF